MSIFTMTTVTKMIVVVIVNIIIYYLYNSIFIIYIYVYIIKTMATSQVFSFLTLSQNVDGEQTILGRTNTAQPTIAEFDSSTDIKYFITKTAIDAVTTHDEDYDTYTVDDSSLKAALYGGPQTILAVNAKIGALMAARDAIVDAVTDNLAELVLADDLVDIDDLTAPEMITIANGSTVTQNNMFSVSGALSVASDSNVLTNELRYLAANDSNRDSNETTPWVVGDLICSFAALDTTAGNFNLNFSEQFAYVNGGNVSGTSGTNTTNSQDASSTNVVPNVRLEQEVTINSGRIWIEITAELA